MVSESQLKAEARPTKIHGMSTFRSTVSSSLPAVIRNSPSHMAACKYGCSDFWNGVYFTGFDNALNRAKHEIKVKPQAFRTLDGSPNKFMVWEAVGHQSIGSAEAGVRSGVELECKMIWALQVDKPRPPLILTGVDVDSYTPASTARRVVSITKPAANK